MKIKSENKYFKIKDSELNKNGTEYGWTEDINEAYNFTSESEAKRIMTTYGFFWFAMPIECI